MGRAGRPKGDVSGKIDTGIALRDTDILPLRQIDHQKGMMERGEFKAREEEYMDTLNESLDEALFLIAADPKSWASMLRLYGQAPEYSLRNILMAREQLQRNGVDPNGRILSADKWDHVGRRIREENSPVWGKGKAAGTPSGDNVRNYGYDPDRTWDDRYTAEIMTPIGSEGYDEIERWEIDPHTGQRKRNVVRVPRAGYRMLRVYHEDATESIDGGAALPLPDAEVHRGTPGDVMAPASRALEDLGYEITALHRDSDAPAAERRDNTILLNSSAPREQQALELVEILAGKHQVSDPDSSDRLIEDAVPASVAYAICAAYDLPVEQHFPNLEKIAEDPIALARLTSEIHRRVPAILERMDRRMKVKLSS